MSGHLSLAPRGTSPPRPAPPLSTSTESIHGESPTLAIYFHMDRKHAAQKGEGTTQWGHPVGLWWPFKKRK